MMPVMANNVRATMIAGAARLLAERGLEGTSFTEVIELTGAPRGSLYHHFPGGKSELVTEAIRFAGANVVAMLDAQPAITPLEALEGFIGLWRRLLVGTDFRIGCSLAAVTIGAGGDDGLIDAAALVFRDWIHSLAGLLGRAGMTKAAARRLATMAIASMEGAVVVSRATRSIEPFDDVATELRGLARAAARAR
ncbi:MAG: hypothetical protein JWM34_713 [Ilumatobacteraceae bacterium]|nr:hypothetical protein [Ilumatobacteraceae bacterium]